MLSATVLTLAAWQPQPLALSARQGAAASAVQMQMANGVKWTDLTSDARRLTDAQIGRTVAKVATEGVLCTQLQRDGDMEAAAFTTHACFIVEDSGSMLMPLASAEAARNLESSPTVTFYARAPAGGAAGSSVLTLIGETAAAPAEEISDADLNEVAAQLGSDVESVAARQWVRLTPSRVHVYDAVRDAEAWLATSEYAEAAPNPLAASVGNLLNKMNTRHASALRRFAAVYAGVPPDELAAAELLSVDQMGFDMRVKLGEDAPTSVVRAGFKQPPANEEEGISVFMKLFQEAYERHNGFME